MNVKNKKMIELEKARSLKNWNNFFKVMEAYSNMDFQKRYIEKTGSWSELEKNHYVVVIKDFYEFSKEEKMIPKMSLKTFQLVWYLISELNSGPISGCSFVSGICGVSTFGSGNLFNGRSKKFNAVRIKKNIILDYKKIKINGFLAPQDYGVVRGFVSLEDVKDIIKNKKLGNNIYKGIRNS
jgi:hypothetical protein